VVDCGGVRNVWFTDGGTRAIGRITPSGTIKEFTQGLNPGSNPDSLTLGPDGNIWFEDQNALRRTIGRVTPSGSIIEFDTGLSARADAAAAAPAHPSRSEPPFPATRCADRRCTPRSS
jgi:streptogramin lyase